MHIEGQLQLFYILATLGLVRLRMRGGTIKYCLWTSVHCLSALFCMTVSMLVIRIHPFRTNHAGVPRSLACRRD